VDAAAANSWRFLIEYCPPGSCATAPPPEPANRAAANAANRAAANAANRAAANAANAVNRAAANRVAAALSVARKTQAAAERAAVVTAPPTPDQILENYKTMHMDAFRYTGPTTLKHRWCYQVLYSERFLGECMDTHYNGYKTEYHLQKGAGEEIKIFKYKFENNKHIIKYATICPSRVTPMTNEEYAQLMRFSGGGRSIHRGGSRRIMHRELVEDDAKHLLILKPVPCPPELNDGYFSGVRNTLFKEKRTRKQRTFRRGTRKNM
jgi:hypothetical protein